ncbi:DUF4252 domain-containing protein [Flavobacterium rhizosphaerae]|uniref:DUF4252 domain-containing protein n=1 Tax=Flavobacterium rhizosphaerae TaxID=3163298 RepID=A0ABW8YXX8_9FLAO
MKQTVFIVLFALLVVSCNSEPTLQKYYVEHSHKKGFMALDIAPSFIKTDSLSLSEKEKEALNSLHKFNILMFKADSTNQGEYTAERDSVKALLKKDHYDELIKFNSGGNGVSVNTLTEGEDIEEFVIFAHNKNKGFGIIRVLGNNMTPDNILTIVSLIQKGGMDMEEFKPLQQLVVPAKL